MSMLPRAAVIVLRAVALLMAGALIVLCVVLTSATGARWTVSVLTGLVPGELSVGRVEGSLLRGLALDDVVYIAESFRIELQELEIEPDFAAAFGGRLELQRLAIRGGAVTLRAASEESARSRVDPPKLPQMPEHVAVRALHVADVEIDAFGRRIALTTASGTLAGARLELDRVLLNVAGVDIAGRFELAAAGGDALDVELSAQVTGDALPESATVTVAGSFTDDRFELREFDVETLGGLVTARGEFDMVAQGGTLHVAARDLDPSRIDAHLAGRIGGDGDFKLETEPVLRIYASGKAGGKLHGHELAGEFRGSYAGETLAIERAYVQLDDGSIEIGGSLTAESTNLRFAADVPRIDAWYPPVRGALVASGVVQGALHNPAVEARIEGRGLALDGGSIPPFDELDIAVAGTLAEHTVVVQGRSALGTLRADLAQDWSDETLRGTLLRSTFVLAHAGTWTLTAPAEYIVGAAAAELGPIDYAGPGRSRLRGTLRDAQLSVTAEALPAGLAAPWLPAELQLGGPADAELELGWHGPLRGSMSLRQPSLKVSAARLHTSATADGPPSVEIVDLELHATLGDERLQTRFSAALAGSEDRIEGELAVGPPHADGELEGRLVASLTDLAVLETLIPGVDDLEGSVEVDLSVLGSPAAPSVRGTLLIRSVRASLPSLGIHVTGGELSAIADSFAELTFDGELCTDRCVTFGGSVQQPYGQPWRLDAALLGERFELVDLPVLRARVSPDLTLVADSNEWRVAGELYVDEAAAIVESVPYSAVRPAAETVVHGRAAARSSDTGRLPVALVADVQARLGEVRFEGLGVTAELDGALHLERTAQGRLLVQGTTAVERGTFRTYGQEFTIERGRLTFTGPPDDPSLDIRATREFEGAEVGLAITGTASNPRSEIFADSAMSDSDAFARLLTGHSLAGVTATDAEALERAALGLGLRRMLPSLDRVGANLGLDELGLRAGSGDTDNVLVAGREFGDDISLRYKHALDGFAGLELIYRLNDRFRLHTEAGTGRSIDLVYEVERRP